MISRLSKHAIFLSDLDLVLHSIISSSVDFNSIIWSHVKRDDNYVAPNLAKLMSFEIEQISKKHSHVEMAPYVLKK